MGAAFFHAPTGLRLNRYGAQFAAFIWRVAVPPPALRSLELLILVPLEIVKRMADVRWQTRVGEIRTLDIETMFMMMSIRFCAITKWQRRSDLPSPS